MVKRVFQVVIAIAIVLIEAQFVRVDRTNPRVDPNRTIAAHPGIPADLAKILDRACGDCHSNSTVWPWYTDYAPLSWLMAHGVNEGRKAVNFSDWAGYSLNQQRKLLSESCQDVRSGKMPGIYTTLRPETRLSSEDITAICAAAGKAQADAGHAR
jgi:hypothetical protein